MTTRKSFLKHGMAKWSLFMGALFVLWFGGWFVAANWVDGKVGDALTRLQENGINVDCQDREMHGFPFRMGVLCQQTNVNDTVHNYLLKVGAVRSAAQIYSPRKNVVEADGPFVFENGAVAINANWESMRVYGEASRGGFDLLSSNFTRLKGKLNDAGFGTKKGAVHFRPAPLADGARAGEHRDLDLAATLDGVSLDGDVSVKGDIVADMTIWRGYSDFIVKRRAPKNWLADGAKVDIRILAFTTPEGGSLAIAGPLKLHLDGTLSGTIKIGLENQDALVRWATEVNPELAPVIIALGQGVSFMGQREEISGRSMKTLDVKIEYGRASFGVFPLGVIPPLDLS